MEIDLANAGATLLDNPAALETEVCIIGGGVAGLVLAHSLALRGVDVLVLEAGGRTPDESQIELAGVPHHGSREGRPQVLGGSSLLWGGQLLPLPDDAGWPVAAHELLPFYSEIERLLGVDSLPYDAEPFFKRSGQPEPELLRAAPELAARMSKFAPFRRRNLASSLGRVLRRLPHARIVLHARACGLELAPSGAQVTRVEACGPGEQRLLIAARQVVLAAGTVETCRFLLAGANRHAGGIGNSTGMVGFGFHDHLTAEVARFPVPAEAVRALRPWIVDGLQGTVHTLKLEASRSLRERLHLQPALAHLVFEEPEHSGLGLLRSALRRSQTGGASPAVTLSTLPGMVKQAFHLWREAQRAGRRYLSPAARVSLRVNIAQSSCGRSRVSLAGDLDRFGMPLPRVEWHHSPEDFRSFRLFAQHLRGCFLPETYPGMAWHPEVAPEQASGGEAGISDQELEASFPGLEDARHAMGGAVMGVDPQRSVVTPQLRVHGIENLYVASAAVFPDGCPQLPSLTLLALTLRLAETLFAERSVLRTAVTVIGAAPEGQRAG